MPRAMLLLSRSILQLVNLIPKGAGTATITLSQAGDSHFSAASNVTLSIAISEDRSQTIDFPSLTDLNASSSAQTFTLGATASSGLAVTYTSSDTSKATISGSTMTIGGQCLGIGIHYRFTIGWYRSKPTPISPTWQRKVSPRPSPSASLISLLLLLPCPIVTLPMAPPSRSLPPQVPDSPSPLTVMIPTYLPSVAPPPPSRVQGAVTITATQAGNDSYNPASKSRFSIF